MDEDTLRARAELWRRRAAEAFDPAERAASLQLAVHYEAMLQRKPGGSGAGRDAVERSD